MSLFGSLQMASNTLQAMQVGLHVVGNNIANANTPGYVREEVIYSPAPIQKNGQLVLGLGVEVDGIVQKIDRFVLERLRNATSDRANAEVQEKAYANLENLIGELSDTDLSTAFTDFFASVDDALNDNDTLATRNLVVLKGQSLAREINRLYQRGSTLHAELDSRVSSIASEINNLSEEIRQLNLRITEIEGGGLSGSEAGGLRTQRINAVAKLAKLVDIRVAEQPSGAMSVTVGGEYLVVDAIRRDVMADVRTVDGRGASIIRFTDLASPVNATGGELAGIYNARDRVIGQFLDNADKLSANLIFEFNKLYSQGQGLVGFEKLSAQDTVRDASAPLDAAGLAFTPVNGSFNLLVHNKNTNVTETHTILVDLNGLDDDMSLDDLAAALDAVPGVTASVDTNGRLTIASDASDTDFAFGDDTSGVLAALGLNTFFTGSSAGNIGVNAELNGISNAAKFAASLGGINNDAHNTERLSDFFTRRLDSNRGASLADQYEQMVSEIAQGSTVAKGVAEGFRVFEATLEGEATAVSGVNIDEEAIRMITYQRTYQASARYIQTISELLDILVSL
jgi:flagellar hook-associated protein 1 FlgK